MYINPTLFLALDRFLAVTFPHKFRVLAPKLCPCKICLFVFQFVLIILYFIDEAYAGIFLYIPLLLAWFNVVLVLISSHVLNVVIFCQLLKSARAMSCQRHNASGGANPR